MSLWTISRSLGGKGTAAMKIIGKDRLTCAFCDAAADLETCNWLAEMPVLIRAADLTLDHVIVTKGGRKLKPLMVQTVDRIVNLQPWQWASGYRSYVDELRCSVVYALNYGQGRYFLLHKGINETVSVMGIGECGMVCCSLHRAERGAKSICCRSHWMAWRSVA